VVGDKEPEELSSVEAKLLRSFLGFRCSRAAGPWRRSGRRAELGFGVAAAERRGAGSCGGGGWLKEVAEDLGVRA
jgi:hypothetical protein